MGRGRAAKKKIRILIADREGVFRLGLKKLLSLEDGLRVVAQAENEAQVKALAKVFRPDLFFIQTEIASEGLGNLLSLLHREYPQSKIIVTGSLMTEQETSRYVRAGASGVILKAAAPPLFVKIVRKVMSNKSKPWVSADHLPGKAGEEDLSLPPHRLRPAETLTRQEKTILSYLLQGCRNREIANHLSITEQTVKNHLRTIYDKVGVSDRLELVLYAIHQQLVLPPVRLTTARP